MTKATIERFMTRSPHTVGGHQTLAAAHRLMRQHAIRHLPVLAAGKLVGLLSQRDLHFIETFQDVDPNAVSVSEAMSQEVFAVGPDTSVAYVTAEMAAHKYGCAVVVDHGQVIGVFTTVDALRLLADVIGERQPTWFRAASDS